MTDSDKRSDDVAELRRQAEAKVRENTAGAAEDQEALSPEVMGRTLYELRVHQLELEMQNEELRRTQSELDAARARYFDLYELAPVGYVTLSDSGLILEANLTAAALLGVARGKLVRRRMSQFILAEDQHIYYLQRKRVLATGEPVAFELRMVKQDGVQLWGHITVTAAQDMQDATELLVVLSDVTARRRAEEEREKLQAQLHQSQKMESVGRLAGGVAHDFNNMLGVILGYTELALEEVAPSLTLHADLEEIRKAATRSADFTRQLLAFARKQTVAPKVLDLNETVASMLKMLRRLIGENITLVWLPGQSMWPVKVDPSQIDQILANLCVNARDAIADVGRIAIQTRSVIFDADYYAANVGITPGEYVVLAVSDNGCGMSKETLDKLFEPFFTTKAVGQGTGLGLATVYGAVKQNGGFINVSSEPGKGTTFEIYLPRHAGNARKAQGTMPEGPVVRGIQTILLVEDEPAILKMTMRMLERQGYKVLAAGSPGEGIRVASEHAGKVHLLLTDVVMPEMNGRDLAKKLMSQHPGLKSLFMSGYTADVLAHHGVLDEGFQFIRKPFSTRDLSVKVREALDG
ncbi:MAG: ATP-binding protein [Myxococcales bacterium]